MGNDKAKLEVIANAAGTVLGWRVFYPNAKGVWVSDRFHGERASAELELLERGGF